MKRRIIALGLILCLALSICACSKTGGKTGFSITFIDVGQGDSALVACDGHYMLIDGGDAAAGEKVCNVLKDNGIKRLDILVASHLHDDHIGGLIDVLDYAQRVKLVLSNKKEYDSRTFDDFHNRLINHRVKIKVPKEGNTYQLGSATIEILSVRAKDDNDSLVLLITYMEGIAKFQRVKKAGCYRIIDIKTSKMHYLRVVIRNAHFANASLEKAAISKWSILNQSPCILH